MHNSFEAQEKEEESNLISFHSPFVKNHLACNFIIITVKGSKMLIIIIGCYPITRAEHIQSKNTQIQLTLLLKLRELEHQNDLENHKMCVW